ncbi:MAG: zinc dependent phospholipase C family protein [Clostridia bacterium]|nr:zinc dependent phospholipase C family protein [Clostridia bacterium]
MKKKSHYLITARLLGKMPPLKRKAILIGSVMPDILLYTFKQGHYYDTTEQKVRSSLALLKKKKRWSLADFYRFGYQIHFIEDYFTYVHNFSFLGNAKAHYAYEVKLQKQIPLFFERELPFSPSPLPFDEFLKTTHEEYIALPNSIETDLVHIVTVVRQLLYSFREKL